jgi:hypothetical protein
MLRERPADGPPEEETPRTPTAAERAAIEAAMRAGDHQGAIEAAIRAFGLAAGARFDPGLPQDGDTDGHTREVTIGPPAFVHPRTGTARSAGWLGSTIAHENVHLRQLCASHPADGGDNYARPGTPGDDINELQAYDWELRHADLFGLSAEERAELARRRQARWLAVGSDPSLAERIGPHPGASGYDYWIDPGDR